MNDRRSAALAGLLLATFLMSTTPAAADGPNFERVVIDADFPGAYQVEVADVNGDGKPDIVALGGSTCAWYENPTWKKRLITGPKETPGIISSATYDLDRDGKAEVAIAYEFAMNKPKEGKLGLATQGETPDDSWTFRHLADVGSIHRLRWGECDGDPTLPDLVVAPLFGPEAEPPIYDDPARILFMTFGLDFKTGLWKRNALHRFPDKPGEVLRPGDDVGVHPVLHAIEVTPPRLEDRPGFDGPFLVPSLISTAGNDGAFQIGGMVRMRDLELKGWTERRPLGIAGAPGKAPKLGCSEVHQGKLADGRPLIATVEPWHGTMVAVYVAAKPGPLEDLAPRRVIDDTLDEGHALWVADVDGDGDDEILAGHRGKDHRVSLYKFDGKDWNKTVLDREIAAQDLRGGDLDGDGVPDVVAVGGSTKNVVLYRFRPRRE